MPHPPKPLTPEKSIRDFFGAELRRLREHAGLSQSQLGKLVNYSDAMIASVEKAIRWPPPQLVTAVDHALGTDGVLTRLLPAVQEQRAAQQSEKTLDPPQPDLVINLVTPGAVVLALQTDGRHASMSLDRRELLKGTGTIVGGLAFGARPSTPVASEVGFIDIPHLKAAFDDAHRYLDGNAVAQLGNAMDEAVTTDGERGPRHTLPVVLAIVATVESSARDVKPQVRREFLELGARGAELAGWLFRDLGSPEMAGHWRDRSMEWAQESGNRAMQGYVLLKKAQAAYDERDALRMLTLAQAVQEGPGSCPAASEPRPLSRRRAGTPCSVPRPTRSTASWTRHSSC